MIVSIVTIVKNAVSTIERTIKSVLDQDYPDIEYIIIDGGSDDGTIDVIKEYSDILSYWVSEADEGLYFAMNKGISKATGDIILTLNADDWIEPGTVTDAVKHFEISDYDIVSGAIRYIYPDGSYEDERQADIEKLRYQCIVHQPTSFVRRSAYDRFGLLDTSYSIAADYELLLRMYSGGARIGFSKKLYTNFSVTGVSSTKELLSYSEAYAVGMKYYLKSPDPDKTYYLIQERYRTAKLHVITNKYPERIRNDIFMKKYHKSNIAIWGTGQKSVTISELINKSGIVPDFYVDNNELKVGSIYRNLYVKSPTELFDYDGIVLVAVKNGLESIMTQIKTMNNPRIVSISIEDLWEDIVNLEDID